MIFSPNGILHGYGEWPALLEEGDVGFDQIVNVSVQLRSRGQGRQEVLKMEDINGEMLL